MELQTGIEILEYHQEWRLGKREDMIYEPKQITEALDVVLSEVKNRLVIAGQNEQLKCGNSNPPCAPNIKFGYLECTECNWSE